MHDVGEQQLGGLHVRRSLGQVDLELGHVDLLHPGLKDVSFLEFVHQVEVHVFIINIIGREVPY